MTKNTNLKMRGSQLEVDFYLDDEEEELSYEDQCTVHILGLTHELMDPDMVIEVVESIVDVTLDEEQITLNHKDGAAVVVLKDIASKYV